MARVRGGQPKGDPWRPQPWDEVNAKPGANGRILLYPHVALPHVLAVALGLVLFAIGLAGGFGPI